MICSTTSGPNRSMATNESPGSGFLRSGIHGKSDPKPDPFDYFAGGNNYCHDRQANGKEGIGIANPLYVGLCAGITKTKNIN